MVKTDVDAAVPEMKAPVTPPRKAEKMTEKEIQEKMDKKEEKLSASEEHKKELAKANEVKLKSMNAWGETGEK